jgi:hypothetical protein
VPSAYMPLDAYPNIVRWIEGMLRIRAWAQLGPVRREALELAAS